MAFSPALRPVPSIPNETGKIANLDLTPALEYVSMFRAFEAWMQRIQTAMAQTGTTVMAVGSLPAAASSQGQRYIVTDANSTVFMSVLAAGGANIVPVFSDGTNWRIG